jgi:uncharacterized protein YndB with AHSA1/START domain
MATINGDHIQNQVLLHASRQRVSHALTDSREFGRWFGIEFIGPFAEGERAKGRITAPGYENVTGELLIERIEPERHFVFRWHPNATDPARDYSSEPMTVVDFTLQDQAGGTLLTVDEVGFSALPADRRAEARKRDDEGWAMQMKSIERYLREHPQAPRK